MHPAAWIAWVLMVMVVALATTNPFYLAITLLAIILVAVLAPRTGAGVTSFRALLIFGVVMLTVSVLIATINGSYGDHILFTIPGPEIPRWLGGLRLGGPVSAEGLVAAAIRGLAILCVLLAFGVFNGAVSPHRILRSTPAALFQASLVVTVGLTLLPSSIEDLRRVREMRALRGAPGGIRGLPAMVVPAGGGGLERSMQLAEAMEARGYGAAPPLPRRPRMAASASAPLLIAGAWIWFYEIDIRWIGALMFLAAVGMLAWWWRSAAAAHRTTRYGE
ncbi:MAG TPA: energy-coupling factor transporter transmembrane component T, partial [Tepidiformaceae bacterium]|nr:energy-coupling factor transporter transmembrane component T [Tepidiformaceae bacterium]